MTVVSCCEDLTVGRSKFAIGFDASIVIFILQAGDGRLNCLCANDNVSQCSQSSSIWMTPVFLSRYTPNRKGASPTAISFGGGIVLLVPLHAATCLTTFAGKSDWICKINSGSVIDRRPTLGSGESTFSST